MANYYGAFTHGSKTFLLDGTRGLHLASGWVPPGVVMDASLSAGLMGNRMQGGEVTSTTYRDRALDVPLHSKGSTIAETSGAVRNLESFINRALADESEKLYFVFGSSNAITYAPKWGQLFRKYEVKIKHTANVTGGTFGIASVATKYIPWNLSLTVAPFAVGERQRVGSATGGILEHSWATEYGESRGVIIPEATTNKGTNVVFGNSTYDTDWTDGAELTVSKNTDREFIFAGEASAKLFATGSSTNIFYQSLNVGNTNDHTYAIRAKREDGGVIDGTVCAMYDNTTLTSTYLPLGDGWYLVYHTKAGVAAARNVGVRVGSGYTIYIDGFQVEEKDYPTALCYGDLLDCTWSGSAHATGSTSSRTAARLRWDADEIINGSEGAVCLIWRAPFASSEYVGASQRLFWTDSTKLRAVLTSANALQLIDGTNTETSAAQTWDAGDIITIHIVWGTDRLEAYWNGSAIITGTTFTPFALGDHFYLGTTAAVAEHLNGTFLDLTSWSQPLSAAEVLAHYNDISEYVSGGDGLGQCLNPVPWAWFDQGDDITDNDYNSGSSLYNFFFSGGIPGNVTAKTEWWVEVDDDDFVDDEALYISNQHFPYYNYSFPDCLEVFQDGDNLSVNTSDVLFTVNLLKRMSQYNQNYYAYVRCIDAGSDLRARFAFGSSNDYKYGDYQDFTPDAATYKAFLLGPYYAHINATFQGVFKPESSILTPVLSRSVAGAANVNLDYCLIIPEPLKVEKALYMSSHSFVITDRHVTALTTASGIRYSDFSATGKIQELLPSSYNMTFAMVGNSGNANVTTRTLGWKIYITPRWSLL